MGQKIMSDGAKRDNFGRQSRPTASNPLMSEMSWLHITAIVMRLTREGLCEDGIVRALADLYPQYAPLIEESMQTLQENGWWTTYQNNTKAAPRLIIQVAHSQDGQWTCKYEFPRRAESVQSQDSPFIVQAAEHMTFCVSAENTEVRCIDNPDTVLLKITGDCAAVMSLRGDTKLFGRSFDEQGFFLAALKEGEAICVTTHDRSQSRVYLFMDDLVNELDEQQWHDNFEPFLPPLG
jgi:hypothetical protein